MVPVEVELQHIFGYAFSLLAGHWATNRIIGLVDVDESLSTKLLGFVERTLYTTSVVIGQWGFFPVWLGLKVAPEVVRKWGEKPGDDGIESGIERQRRYFNRWLTGTGISLMYGVVGAKMIEMEWTSRISLALLLLVAPDVLRRWGEWVSRRSERTVKRTKGEK